MDIELMSQDFGREHFRKLIKKTFDDYYPLEFNKSTFNMDEYLGIVNREQLETKFQEHLEMNNNNVLTLRNMPWLDLGELPVSYNSHKSEAFQVYMIPPDELPNQMVVSYSNWSRRYDTKKAMQKFNHTGMRDRSITAEDVSGTLEKATQLIAPYRGKLALRNKIVKLSTIGSGAVLMLSLILFGFNEGNYWVPMIIILLYMLTVLIVVTFFKYRSS